MRIGQQQETEEARTVELDNVQNDDLSSPLVQRSVYRGRLWCCRRDNNYCQNTGFRTKVYIGLSLLFILSTVPIAVGASIAQDHCDSDPNNPEYFKECWGDTAFRKGTYTWITGVGTSGVSLMGMFIMLCCSSRLCS